MIKFLTNGEMRAADAATIAAGTSSEELMARAGAAIAAEVGRIMSERGASSVQFVCGTGNNGGDGYVAAEILRREHCGISVYAVQGRFSQDCLREKQRYCGDYSDSIGGDIIVDCLFGTGLCRPLEGEFARIVNEINSSGAYVISADIPSGINGDNGRVMNVAVKADFTVAIAFPKLGHVLSDGIDCCGVLKVCDIGIPAKGARVMCAEEGDVAKFFPPRRRNTHKGSYGSCQIVAGKRYFGAAALSLSSALLSGCGYVRAAVKEKLAYALVAAYPQVIYEEQPDLTSSAAAIGMGMGCDEGTYAAVCGLARDFEGKLIIDADAINSLAKYGADVLRERTGQTLLTPHIKEFSRISGLSVESILDDPVGSAMAFAREYGVCVHLKSAVTLTTDGERCVLVDRGSTVLARAGSGDILSGLAAGYAARGLDVFDAAVCAQYVLGRGAELAGLRQGEYAATSQDVLEGIRQYTHILQG